MQVKTINNHLKSKLTEWLSTIDDVVLREEVKDNIVVSGGAIASMLTGADVNDYDVYLKSRDVAKRLAEYYIKDYEEDITLVTSDSDVKEYAHNAFTVAVRACNRDQVKMFFKNDSDKGGIKVNSDVKKEERNYIPMYISPNAISLSNKIQVVLRFTGTVEEIHSTFDFIHATNYFTFETGVVTNVKALESLLSRHLHYQGSKYPLTSIIRLRKFIKRGWNVGAGEMLKIMFQISEFDLTDPLVLEEQLIGVDVAYFAALISILKNVDKGKITSAYLNKVIDDVFDGGHEND